MQNIPGILNRQWYAVSVFKIHNPSRVKSLFHHFYNNNKKKPAEFVRTLWVYLYMIFVLHNNALL